jgi:superfamily II DNA or RNA helicase/HKD family nuclease
MPAPFSSFFIMTWGELRRGRYDAVLDRRIAQLANELTDRVILGPLEAAEQPQRLGRHVADVLARVLANLDDDAERVELVNAIVERIGEAGASIASPPRLLRAVTDGPEDAPPVAPDIPLAQNDLLVNARGEPHLAAELKKELASADRVDLIVAFVRWYGVRLIIGELEAAIKRDVPVRLLTTTYTGATEAKALDELHARGVDVRVSYDTAITRLHAKSWIFHRDSGYGTAYVGSSNLTRTAMLDGREWNVRLSRASSDVLFNKVATAFEAQWESGDYEPYDEERFSAAIASTRPVDGESALSGLDLRPWPYQDEILDALTVEREIHGSTRNLVVAPTGTGKTVVAALDYLRLRREHGDLSLLFVAHREQILRQSRRTFREALGDGSFGTLLVGGHRPTDRRHVFASIQTLSSSEARSLVGDDFDVVIVDEFHHAEAATYQRLLDSLQSRWLLALTATPERADGLDIRRWTDDRTAFDMRLWHALDRQLLSPFQYFGIADVVDYARQVRWTAGHYDPRSLGEVLTGNEARDRLIVRQVERIIGDPRRMRALGFCATVEHAHAMAALFNRVGWSAVMIDGSTPQYEREQHMAALRAGELTTIFSRDVFNEGVDIPEADTILLLRPTESVTVHLQQLGRGLRRHRDKDVCTVLDFVGQHRREYRLDLRLRAMTGISRRGLVEAAEEGFPYLPSGCHLELDRQTREWVLQHLKEAVLVNRRALTHELTLLAAREQQRVAPPLMTFLEEAGVEIEDVAKAGGWATLRRAAHLEQRPVGEHEATLQKGVRRLLHIDDVDRIEHLATWLRAGRPPVLTTDRERRLAWMALVTLWGLRAAPESLESAWRALFDAPAVVDELLETVPLLRERITRPSIPLPDADIPLRLHATYGRDEILAAFGRLHPGERYSHQAGPWWHEPARTEVLFITLTKTEQHYSPTTLYRDYAISRELFHWESQNKTRIDSTAGRRYIEQRTNGVRILLAVRATRTDPWGATRPYVLLGPAEYVEHHGEQPIALTWRLRNRIPADLYEEFKVAAA